MFSRKSRVNQEDYSFFKSYNFDTGYCYSWCLLHSFCTKRAGLHAIEDDISVLGELGDDTWREHQRAGMFMS